MKTHYFDALPGSQAAEPSSWVGKALVIPLLFSCVWMDRYQLNVCLKRLACRQLGTGACNRSERESRGEPGTIGKAQSLNLARDQSCHHRITCSHGAFYLHRWR